MLNKVQPKVKEAESESVNSMTLYIDNVFFFVKNVFAMYAS